MDDFCSADPVPSSIQRVVRVLREEAAVLADVNPLIALALERGADLISGHQPTG